MRRGMLRNTSINKLISWVFLKEITLKVQHALYYLVMKISAIFPERVLVAACVLMRAYFPIAIYTNGHAYASAYFLISPPHTGVSISTFRGSNP